MLVFEERKKPKYPWKTCRSKGENQQQPQPTYGIDATIWTHWWEARLCSTTGPSIAPQNDFKNSKETFRLNNLSLKVTVPNPFIGQSEMSNSSFVSLGKRVYAPLQFTLGRLLKMYTDYFLNPRCILKCWLSGLRKTGFWL